MQQQTNKHYVLCPQLCSNHIKFTKLPFTYNDSDLEKKKNKLHSAVLHFIRGTT